MKTDSSTEWDPIAYRFQHIVKLPIGFTIQKIQGFLGGAGA